MHDSVAELIEYLPAPHPVHELAPVLLPVFVIDPAPHALQSLAVSEPIAPMYCPAGQSVHADTLDDVEYFPTSQAVHSTAPLLLPSSVMEPASQ